MTTRESLNLARFWGCLLAFPGFAWFAGVMILTQGKGSVAPLALFGFVLFGIGGLLMHFTGRCRSCDRRIGHMFLQAGGPPWRVANDIQFCPYCGCSVDEPTKEKDVP